MFQFSFTFWLLSWLNYRFHLFAKRIKLEENPLSMEPNKTTKVPLLLDSHWKFHLTNKIRQKKNNATAKTEEVFTGFAK